MIDIIPLGRIERNILKLIDQESYELLKDQLAKNPHKGDVMQGTGGMRKMRVAMEGRGKSGGLRLIYYYVTAQGRIYLIDVFAKNEKANLTQAERNELKELAKELSK
jgi:hypothetical protein